MGMRTEVSEVYVYSECGKVDCNNLVRMGKGWSSWWMKVQTFLVITPVIWFSGGRGGVLVSE